MKWIGQNIYDLVSRFRSNVYLESISSGTIASGGNLGLDASNKIVKATEASGDLTSIVAGTGLSGTSLTGPIPTLNVDASQTQITSVGTIGTGVWNGTEIASEYLDSDTAHLTTDQTFTGRKIFSALTTFDSCNLTSATADSPILQITNTTDDDEASRLIFQKLRDDNAVASGQNLGEIFFRGQDSAQNAEDYAFIIGEIDVSTHGQESGALKLGVANHDGGNGWGLIMTGGSENNEIDVTLGLGANSVVTIPGNIDLAGDIDVDGTLETDALTIGGTTVAAAGTTSITTLGTIGTGVWNGTAIATDQQKHTMHYQTTGFGTADGTNYEAQENMSTNAAPFQHNTSIGADGLTAQSPQVWMRMGGGHVMPRACTLKRWTGWTASAGSGTTYLGLFKVTMTRNSSTAVSAVLLEEFSYTALGNNKNEDFDETSFTATAIAAGDIVFTAMKGVNNKVAYFNGTFEVEF